MQRRDVPCKLSFVIVKHEISGLQFQISMEAKVEGSVQRTFMHVVIVFIHVCRHMRMYDILAHLYACTFS
jgi:hypothetical protein